MRFLTRVVIQNFKSIAACDVTLGDLTCLVGPNGSGKSNFLDALEFVSDALNTNLAHAIRVRGGLASILRGGLQGDPSRIALPHNFGIRVEFDSFGTPGLDRRRRVRGRGRVVPRRRQIPRWHGRAASGRAGEFRFSQSPVGFAGPAVPVLGRCFQPGVSTGLRTLDVHEVLQSCGKSVAQEGIFQSWVGNG